ncbi:DUF192 domain-containing protein [Halomarina pelagica]|uniref:DUF192 domain-containing protein n=1 Tax=Halomarina pelagica TaxID=2961599 RepID=UPI0020C21731|nr:DUF192 domain-containing protein [Halomarina sp. BND7]
MRKERVAGIVGLLLVLGLTGLTLVAAGVVPLPVGAPPADDYDRTTVTISDENGTELGSVEARVADTWQKRYTGLSNTSSLPADEGMLFVHEKPQQLTYVMRGMDFGIDIVFVSANGTITEIHHAPKPPEGADGEDFRYSGRGKYVLEVNYDWTTRHGVEVGDRVSAPDVGLTPPAPVSENTTAC